MNKALLTALVFAGTTTSALADAPLQLALWESLQLVPDTESVTGIRLNIYGVNQDLTGIDFGLLHELRGSGIGLQYGLVSLTLHDFTGLQSSFFFNGVGEEFSGIQLSVVNQCEDLSGIQFGLVNLSEQIKGLQIGFYNQAEQINGLQLGVLNRDRSSRKWPILPFIRF